MRNVLPSPTCYNKLMWRSCRVSHSFAYLLHSEIDLANRVVQQKIDTMPTKDEIHIGLDMLGTFLGDLMGHNTLPSKVFLKYFEEG